MVDFILTMHQDKKLRGKSDNIEDIDIVYK